MPMLGSRTAVKQFYALAVGVLLLISTMATGADASTADPICSAKLGVKAESLVNAGKPEDFIQQFIDVPEGLKRFLAAPILKRYWANPLTDAVATYLITSPEGRYNYYVDEGSGMGMATNILVVDEILHIEIPVLAKKELKLGEKSHSLDAGFAKIMVGIIKAASHLMNENPSISVLELVPSEVMNKPLQAMFMEMGFTTVLIKNGKYITYEMKLHKKQ
jgi:hypothetical protein